jgi:drug/metabolite transporter (DMT)-like permease
MTPSAEGTASPRRGLRYAVIGAFSLALMSALAKLVGSRIPVQEIILFRGTVFGGSTLLLLWSKGVNPWGQERKLLLLRGLLGYSALSCFFYAVMHLPLADTTTLHFTNPVFGAILAAMVLKEYLRKLEAALVLVSLGGVVMVARPEFLFGEGSAPPPLAVGLALLGAILGAGAYVVVRRLTRTNEPLVIVFYFGLVSAVGSLPFTLVNFVVPTVREFVVLVSVGLATLGGQVFMTRAFQLEKAFRVMAVGYLQIVFAALLGLLLFREIPDLWSAAGAAVIIGSTLLMGRIRPAATAAGR